MKNPACLCLLFAGVMSLSALEVSPSDPALVYSGRWDKSKPEAPRCAWPASRVVLKFEGESLQVKFNEQGKDLWQVLINGKPASVLKLEPGEKVYPVVEALPKGEYVVELVKRTEANVGTTQLLGFQISEAGKLLEVPATSPRKIEVIGDSISCGYGNEAAGKEEHFKPETENACRTYGYLTAAHFGADYTCVAWSGKKLWPNNTITELYDRILPREASAPLWDFSAWKPDVVLINLGTNDFNKANPEEAGWVQAYQEFIARLRKHYPDAHIYCAIGPMMSDGWPPEQKALTTIRGYIAKVVEASRASGDTKVRIIDFGTQQPANGYGADWHPSVKTHEVMSALFVETLKKDLNW